MTPLSKPSFVQACPRALHVAERLIIDLDDSHDNLAETGQSLYETWTTLVYYSQKTCACHGPPDRAPMDVQSALEDADAFVLALARHLENPILTQNAFSVVAMLQKCGGHAKTVQVMRSPDLGLALALVEAWDFIVPLRMPDGQGGEVTAFAPLVHTLAVLLADQPYALRKCIEAEMFDKLAGSANNRVSKCPNTVSALLKVFADALSADEQLHAEAKDQLREASIVALAGLPKNDKLKHLRQAWELMNAISNTGALALVSCRSEPAADCRATDFKVFKKPADAAAAQ